MIRNIFLLLAFFSVNFYAYSDTSSAFYESKLNKQIISSESETVKDDNWTKELDDYLSNKKFASAAKIVKEKPPAELIGRLRPWALENETVAQWMYADALYREHRFEESAMWTFIAFFFTRYDAKLCIDQKALGLEKPIVDSYFVIVDKAREDKELMNLSLEQTLKYLTDLKYSSLATRDPSWICEMIYAKNDNKILTIPKEKWRDMFKAELVDYIRRTTGEEYTIEMLKP